MTCRRGEKEKEKEPHDNKYPSMPPAASPFLLIVREFQVRKTNKFGALSTHTRIFSLYSTKHTLLLNTMSAASICMSTISARPAVKSTTAFGSVSRNVGLVMRTFHPQCARMRATLTASRCQNSRTLSFLFSQLLPAAMPASLETPKSRLFSLQMLHWMSLK